MVAVAARIFWVLFAAAVGDATPLEIRRIEHFSFFSLMRVPEGDCGGSSAGGGLVNTAVSSYSAINLPSCLMPNGLGNLSLCGSCCSLVPKAGVMTSATWPTAEDIIATVSA